MDKTKVVTKTAQDFLTRLGFTEEVQLEVNYSKESDLYQVILKSENPALLIGYHGNTLSGLQLFLNQHLHQALGEWINLTVDVNDYRERREQSLKTLADSTVEQVLSTNQAYILPPMTPAERRVIHMYLAQHPQVATNSQGEGRQRSVVISPKV